MACIIQVDYSYHEMEGEGDNGSMTSRMTNLERGELSESAESLQQLMIKPVTYRLFGM